MKPLLHLHLAFENSLLFQFHPLEIPPSGDFFSWKFPPLEIPFSGNSLRKAVVRKLVSRGSNIGSLFGLCVSKLNLISFASLLRLYVLGSGCRV